jgi:autotransporter-associated beta strand protein
LTLPNDLENGEKMMHAKRRRRCLALFAGATAGVISGSPFVSAGTYTWSGGQGTTGYIDQATNWVGNVTPPFNGTSSLIYGSINPMSFGPTDRLGSSVVSISFNSSALAYVLASQNGVSMNIGSGGITDSAATTTQTITEPLVLTASQPWSSAGILNVTGGVNLSSFTLTVSGAGATSLTGVSGTGALTLNGTGTLTLTGNDPYSGGTNVFGGGTVSIAAGSNVGMATGSTVIGGPASTNLQLAGNLTSAATTLGVNSTATLTQTGGTDTTGPVSMGVNASGVGKYNLAGGTLITSGVTSGNGTGTFYFNGGVLQPTAGSSNFLAVSKAYDSSGGGTINTAGFNLTIGQSLLHDPALGATPDGGLTIAGAGSVTLTGNSAYTGPTTVAGGTLAVAGGSITNTASVVVSNTASSTATFSLTGGSVTTPYFYSGFLGTGTATISGGTLNANSYITSGNQPGATGLITLSGGTINSPEVVAGSFGNGSIVQTGGTMNAGTVLYVSLYGSGANTGSYSLSGANSIINTGQLTIGVRNTGTFTQTGGTVNSQATYLGYYAGISGSYNLSGSAATSITTPLLDVGYLGIGTVTQTGGTLNVSSGITVAAQAGSSGTYLQSGGTVSASTLTINSGGAYNLSGGTLNVGAINSTAANFRWTGGTLNMTDPNSPTVIGPGSALGAPFVLTPALTLNVAATELVSGTFNLSGGVNTVGNLTVDALNANASHGTYLTSGTVNVNASGAVIIGASHGGYYTQTGGSLTAPLVEVGALAGGGGIFEVDQGTASLGNVYVGGTADGQGGSGRLVYDSTTAPLNVSGGMTFYPTASLSLYNGAKVNTGTMTVYGNVQMGGASTFNIGAGGLVLAGPYNPIFQLDGTQAVPDLLILNGPLVFNGSAGTGTIASQYAINDDKLSLGGGVRNFNISRGVASADVNISLPVINGSIFKSGSGILLLQGGNVFSQAVEISAGTIQLGNTALTQESPVPPSTNNTSALGTTGVQIDVGGTLDLNGFNVTTGAMSITGSGVGAAGALINTGGVPATWYGPVALAGGATVGRGPIMLAGTVSGSGGLMKIGTDTLTLAGTASFSGGLTVSSGAVALTGSNSFTGGVNLTGGALSVGTDAALGNTSNGVILSQFGVLNVGTSFSSARTFIAAGGTLAVASGQILSLTGNVTGAGPLNVAGPGTTTLLAANSLTGRLVVTGGVMDVAGAAGAFPSVTSVDVLPTGSFQLDSSGASSNNSNNRLSDTASVILDGGTFALIGNSSAVTNESTGPLVLSSGASTIAINSNGPGGQLNFASMAARGIGATVDFQGTAVGTTSKFFIAGLPAGPLGGYATVNGSDFAKYDTSAGILPLSGTDYAVNVFTAGANVKLDPSVSSPPVPGSVGNVSISTLNIAAGNYAMGRTETNTVSVNQTALSTMNLSGGGLIKSGTNDANISGGSLTTSSGELDISVTGGILTITSSLVGNFVLTERGTNGTLILSGNPANTYTGFTLVSGTVDLAGSNNVYTIPGNLIIDGGTVFSVNSNQVNPSSNVVLNSGTWNLNGQTETITSLTNNNGTLLFNHGTLNVTGFANLSGGTTTIASQLNLSPGAFLGVSGGDNTVGAGGTVLLAAGGSLMFSGTNPAVSMSAGSNLSGGKFNLSSNVSVSYLSPGTASVTGTGTGNLPAIDLMGMTNHLINIGQGSTLALGVKVTDGGFSVAGSGTASSPAILLLSAANDYTGGTNISLGATVMATNTQALGASTSPVVFSGGSLDLRSDSATAAFAYATTVAGPTFSTAIDVDLLTIVPGATAGTFSLNSITTGSGGAALTVTGNDGGTLSTNALVMQYNGSGQTNIHAIINLTINGPVSNTGGGAVNIVKDGSGTLTLGGSTSNRFGTLTTSAGTVLLSKTGGATAVANGLSLSGATTVRLTASNQIDPNTVVTLNAATGPALLDLNGNNNTFNGGISFTSGGTLSTGAGVATLGSDVTTIGASGTAYIYGNLNLGSGGTRTFNISKGTSAYDMQIAAAITGNENLTKAGPGTLYLTGVNTFTGNITISGGILEADSALNLGNNPVLLSGGSLQFTQAFSYAGSAALTLNAGTSSAIDSGSNVVSIASNITGTGVLSKIGAGTLSLSGTNTATGGIIISAGTIQAGSDISLGAAGAPITLAGGTLTATGPANISSGSFALAQPLVITAAGGTVNAVNTNIIFSSPINWGGNLTLASGTLTANVSTGTETISGSRVLTILPGATFNDGGTVDPLASGSNLINVVNNSVMSFDVISGSKQAGTISGIGNTTVSAGASLTATSIRQNMLTVTGVAVIAPQSPRNGSAGVSVLGSLVLINSSNVLIGRLDLGNNDLVIHNADLTTITAQIASAYQTGGPGIASSAASNDTRHLTVLGVLQNNQSGAALYAATNPFDGMTPGAADLLVKYTYYGDTNLDGKIDASDYSRIDNGYLQQGALTGWYNGDFNYDGVINGSDYTLIDNAFNTQGAQLSASIAGPAAAVSAKIATPTAVPEPAAVGLLVLAATGTLGRRRRSQWLIEARA